MSVLVFIDQSEEGIKKASLEAVNYASKVAAQLGGEAIGVVLGSSNADLASLGAYGISKVLHADDARLNQFDSGAYTKAIAKAADQTSANVVVLSFNLNGKSVAPRLSVRLQAGLVPGGATLPNTDGGFSVDKNVFSGKAIASYSIKTDKKIVALNPNSFPIEKGDGSAAVESFDAGLADSDFATKVLSVEKLSGDISLTEAETVVSAGRGLKGPENWGMVEELAKELEAATACSRPVSDIGWRPHHEHVGQTGFTVRPNLYIAIGISGAIQHLAGVNGSKVMVVINSDSEAPFFKAADYGIVGDAFEVVPKLIEEVKKFKNSAN